MLSTIITMNPNTYTNGEYEISQDERKQRISEIKKRIWERDFKRSTIPLYSDPIDLKIMIDDYYENGIDEEKMIVGNGSNTKEITVKLPTITGLTLHLGFESRQSFYDLEKIPHLSYVIKKAREKIAGHYERHLMSSHTVGSIFALKNMGWIDKTEQTINQTIKEVKVNVTTSELTPKIDNI